MNPNTCKTKRKCFSIEKAVHCGLFPRVPTLSAPSLVPPHLNCHPSLKMKCCLNNAIPCHTPEVSPLEYPVPLRFSYPQANFCSLRVDSRVSPPPGRYSRFPT